MNVKLKKKIQIMAHGQKVHFFNAIKFIIKTLDFGKSDFGSGG
jgi:hypothetical protein